MLRERGVKDAYMLLVTTQRIGDGTVVERWRHLVPLKDGAGYPRFFAPGTFEVYPIIVWKQGDLDPRDYLKSGAHGKTFLLDLLSCHGNPLSEIWTYGEAVSITVPEKVFAKKPPKWLWWWVNFWFNQKNTLEDSCDFRKRLLVAVFLQPVPVLIWMVAKVLARLVIYTILGLVLGCRKTKFSPVLHPWKMGWGRIGEDIPNSPKDFFEGSFFICRIDKYGNYKDAQRFFLVPFMPLLILLAVPVARLYTPSWGGAVLLALTFPLVANFCLLIRFLLANGLSLLAMGCVLLFEYIAEDLPSWLTAMFRKVRAHLIKVLLVLLLATFFWTILLNARSTPDGTIQWSFVIVYAIIMIVVAVLFISFLRKSARSSEKVKTRARLVAKKSAEKVARDLKQVVCTGEGKTHTKSPRTVHLFWEDTKAWACKPYAEEEKES